MRKCVALLCLGFVLLQSMPALAYMKFGTLVGSRQVEVKWARTSVSYFVSDRGVPGVGPADFQGAVARAFATWQAVPSASLTYQFAGFTSAPPLEDDGLSTIGFMERPDLDRVLAATTFLVELSTGELLESDIFFNSAFRWSVAQSGETGRFDLESIALHEGGHFSGLGHSAIGETEIMAGGRRQVIAAEAVMFPIAFTAGSVAGRTLRADDVAGISDLYPESGFDATTGSVSGLVTKNGQGVFGAHIVAFDLATGRLVGNFSLTDQGRFAIEGLSPGPHVIRVEPLDDADLDSFFGSSESVDVNFRAALLDRLVVVPTGGDSGDIEVEVVAK
jgi:Matrixin